MLEIVKSPTILKCYNTFQVALVAAGNRLSGLDGGEWSALQVVGMFGPGTAGSNPGPVSNTSEIAQFYGPGFGLQQVHDGTPKRSLHHFTCSDQ